MDIRVNICRWLLHSVNNASHFTEKILWSDESRLSETGVVNTQNLREWNEANPHLI